MTGDSGRHALPSFSLVDGAKCAHPLRKDSGVVEPPVLVESIQGLHVPLVEVEVKEVTILSHAHGAVAL